MHTMMRALLSHNFPRFDLLIRYVATISPSSRPDLTNIKLNVPELGAGTFSTQRFTDYLLARRDMCAVASARSHDPTPSDPIPLVAEVCNETGTEGICALSGICSMPRPQTRESIVPTAVAYLRNPTDVSANGLCLYCCRWVHLLTTGEGLPPRCCLRANPRDRTYKHNACLFCVAFPPLELRVGHYFSKPLISSGHPLYELLKIGSPESPAREAYEAAKQQIAQPTEKATTGIHTYGAPSPLLQCLGPMNNRDGGLGFASLWENLATKEVDLATLLPTYWFCLRHVGYPAYDTAPANKVPPSIVPAYHGEDAVASSFDPLGRTPPMLYLYHFLGAFTSAIATKYFLLSCLLDAKHFHKIMQRRVQDGSTDRSIPKRPSYKHWLNNVFHCLLGIKNVGSFISDPVLGLHELQRVSNHSHLCFWDQDEDAKLRPPPTPFVSPKRFRSPTLAPSKPTDVATEKKGKTTASGPLRSLAPANEEGKAAQAAKRLRNATTAVQTRLKNLLDAGSNEGGLVRSYPQTYVHGLIQLLLGWSEFMRQHPELPTSRFLVPTVEGLQPPSTLLQFFYSLPAGDLWYTWASYFPRHTCMLYFWWCYVPVSIDPAAAIDPSTWIHHTGSYGRRGPRPLAIVFASLFIDPRRLFQFDTFNPVDMFLRPGKYIFARHRIPVLRPRTFLFRQSPPRYPTSGECEVRHPCGQRGACCNRQPTHRFFYCGHPKAICPIGFVRHDCWGNLTNHASHGSNCVACLSDRPHLPWPVEVDQDDIKTTCYDHRRNDAQSQQPPITLAEDDVSIVPDATAPSGDAGITLFEDTGLERALENLSIASRNSSWVRAHAPWQVPHFRRLARIGMANNQIPRLSFDATPESNLAPCHVWLLPCHAEWLNMILDPDITVRKMVKYTSKTITATKDGMNNVVALLNTETNVVAGVFLPGSPFAPWTGNPRDDPVYRRGWGFKRSLRKVENRAYPICLPCRLPNPIEYSRFLARGLRGCNCAAPQSGAVLDNMSTWPSKLKRLICFKIMQVYGSTACERDYDAWYYRQNFKR